MSPAQYKREIETLARKLATEISSADQDYIESQLWGRYVDEWDHLSKVKKDDVIVEDLTLAISHIRDREGYEIARDLAEFGFSGIGTGGGCEAYFLPLTEEGGEGPHFLITDYDCGIPGAWDEEAMLGYYDSLGEYDEDPRNFDSVRELVEAIRSGTAHPKFPKLTKGPSAKAAEFVQADLDLVNQHRRSLGMGRIDPAAGWTPDEISDMAASIRKTGRMANPKVLSLIEIPTR